MPIIATLDFHANCDPAMADFADALVGYQTYPHVDQRQRGLLAAELLTRTIRKEIRPVCHIAKRPMMANILGQATDREPMKGLMAAARQVEHRPGVLSVNVMGGFSYADVPNMGPSVIAVADTDRELAWSAAEELADRMWDVRHDLYVPCATPEDAVRRAINAVRGPVILVDLGDNVGGGSAGDGTVLLAELLKQRAERAVVTLFAPAAVVDCQRLGLGGRFAGKVGGMVDRLHGDPLEVTGLVTGLFDGKWVETRGPPRRPAAERPGANRRSSPRPWEHARAQFPANPAVQPGAAHEPRGGSGKSEDHRGEGGDRVQGGLRTGAAEIIEVDTPGVTAVNPARFTYRQIPRPMFPLDERHV